MKNFLKSMKFSQCSKATLFYLIITFLMIAHVVNMFDNFNFCYVFLALIPITTFLLFKKLSSKLHLSVSIKKALKALGIVLTLVFLFFLEIGILWNAPYTTDTPNLSQYKNSIKMLKKVYKGYYDLSYFPDTIPENTTDYYFSIGRDFHGDNVYYLKYSLDKSYINELENKYQNNILLFETKGKLYDKKIRIYIPELEDTDKIYLFKNDKTECTNCKAGFAVSENTDTVYFFFQNF